MTGIFESYNALPPMMRIYWAIAVASSIVFLIQMVLTFIGLGDTDGDTGDFGDMGDGDGSTMDAGGVLSLFSLRNVVNFLLGLGWGGVCFSGSISNPLILGVVALFCGCLFVAVFLIMLRQLMKLQGSGNFHIEECVGLTCSVYLRIPANRTGAGKVQLSYHGSVLEIDAMTDGELLKSGSRVRVLETIDSHTLLVETL